MRITITDSAGNTATDTTDGNVIIDSTAPTLSITYAGDGGNTPKSGRYVNNTGIDMTAGASDSFLENVQYRFQNRSSGEYWDENAGGFTVTETWNTLCTDGQTAGTDLACASISETITPTLITDSTVYRLHIRSVDEAANVTISTAIDYTGDTTAPTVSHATGSGTYFSSAITLTGSASDALSGGSSVEISIQR